MTVNSAKITLNGEETCVDGTFKTSDGCVSECKGVIDLDGNCVDTCPKDDNGFSTAKNVDGRC